MAVATGEAKNQARRVNTDPAPRASSRASELILTPRAICCRPSAWETSVWLPTLRKLKIQNTLDNTMVPTPNAAMEAVPSRATNAVSTSPVTGSAISENRTGSHSEKKVRKGEDKKLAALVLVGIAGLECSLRLSAFCVRQSLMNALAAIFKQNQSTVFQLFSMCVSHRMKVSCL